MQPGWTNSGTQAEAGASARAVNGRRIPEATAGMGENVANLAHDFVALGELQANLLMVDLKEGSERALKYGVLFAAAAALMLSAIPVLLVALGALLAEGTGLPIEIGWLILSAAALVIGGLCLWFAVRRMQAATKVLERSRAEFRENIDWIKRVIRQTQLR